MREGLWMLARFLFCATDTYFVYRFFSVMFPKRLKRGYGILWALCITAVAFLENRLQITWLNLLFFPVLFFLYASVEFKISKKNSAVYALIWYAIFGGGEVAFEVVYRWLYACLQIKIDVWTVGNGFYFLLAEYIFQFLFLLFIEHYTKKLEIQGDQEFAWYLLIVPVTSITVLSSFMYLEFPAESVLQMVMALGALLLYFSNAAIFIVLERYTAIMNAKKYDALYQVKQEMEDEKFQKIAKLNEDYRCYMHDMHNYLNNIRLLAMREENEAVVKIINDMEGELQNKEVEHKLFCGNPVLNSILAEQCAKAMGQGVAMQVFVERFLGVDFILEADMISLFGNLLDNAVAAATQCKGEKTVDVKLFMGNQYMFVCYIENSYDRVLREAEGFASTKQEAGHGLGIGIVRRLAEKYGGSVTMETSENKFVTILTLSSLQEQRLQILA